MVPRVFGLSVWICYSNLTAALASPTTHESLRPEDDEIKYFTKVYYTRKLIPFKERLHARLFFPLQCSSLISLEQQLTHNLNNINRLLKISAEARHLDKSAEIQVQTLAPLLTMLSSIWAWPKFEMETMTVETDEEVKTAMFNKPILVSFKTSSNCYSSFYNLSTYHPTFPR